eukprot:Opistho-2@24186
MHHVVEVGLVQACIHDSVDKTGRPPVARSVRRLEKVRDAPLGNVCDARRRKKLHVLGEEKLCSSWNWGLALVVQQTDHFGHHDGTGVQQGALRALPPGCRKRVWVAHDHNAVRRPSTGTQQTLCASRRSAHIEHSGKLADSFPRYARWRAGADKDDGTQRRPRKRRSPQTRDEPICTVERVRTENDVSTEMGGGFERDCRKHGCASLGQHVTLEEACAGERLTGEVHVGRRARKTERVGIGDIGQRTLHPAHHARAPSASATATASPAAGTAPPPAGGRRAGSHGRRTRIDALSRRRRNKCNIFNDSAAAVFPTRAQGQQALARPNELPDVVHHAIGRRADEELFPAAQSVRQPRIQDDGSPRRAGRSCAEANQCGAELQVDRGRSVCKCDTDNMPGGDKTPDIGGDAECVLFHPRQFCVRRELGLVVRALFAKEVCDKRRCATRNAACGKKVHLELLGARDVRAVEGALNVGAVLRAENACVQRHLRGVQVDGPCTQNVVLVDIRHINVPIIVAGAKCTLDMAAHAIATPIGDKKHSRCL